MQGPKTHPVGVVPRTWIALIVLCAVPLAAVSAQTTGMSVTGQAGGSGTNTSPGLTEGTADGSGTAIPPGGRAGIYSGGGMMTSGTGGAGMAGSTMGGIEGASKGAVGGPGPVSGGTGSGLGRP